MGSDVRKLKKSKKGATSGPNIHEALSRPTISPQTLYRLRVMPIGLNGIYTALDNGEIQSFRRGRKYVIPTGPLRRKLGLSTT
jgi:hypothetical protein